MYILIIKIVTSLFLSNIGGIVKKLQYKTSKKRGDRPPGSVDLFKLYVRCKYNICSDAVRYPDDKVFYVPVFGESAKGVIKYHSMYTSYLNSKLEGIKVSSQNMSGYVEFKFEI